MTRRGVSVVLALAIVAALTACGSSSKHDSNASSTTERTTTTERPTTTERSTTTERATTTTTKPTPTTTRSTTSTPASSTSTTIDTCEAGRTDCSEASVVRAVEQLYQVAGLATAAEATCLTPITTKGAHSILDAFGAPTAAQTKLAIKCVGTRARLHEIADNLSKYLLGPAP